MAIRIFHLRKGHSLSGKRDSKSSVSSTEEASQSGIVYAIGEGSGRLHMEMQMEMAVVDAVAHSLAISVWQLFGGHGDSIITDIMARPRP
jgi:hypothetical protein